MKLINNITDSAADFKNKIEVKAVSMNKDYYDLLDSVDNSIEGLDDMIYWLEVYKNDVSILTDIEVYNAFRGNDDQDLIMAKNKLPNYLEDIYDNYRRINPIEKANTRSSAEQRIDEHVEFLTEMLELSRDHKDILDSGSEDEYDLTFEDMIKDINKINQNKISEHSDIKK
jgi:hypothetical protein